MERKAVAVIGPTACGKTAFAVRLARAFDGEIVGADSRQVYRGLDIGSGKDISEYSSGGEPVRHHLIDIADATSIYSLADYMRDASAALRDISSRGRLPLLAGGSALYIDAILKGYELPGGPRDEDLRESLADKDTESLSKMLPVMGEGEESNRERLLRRLELSSTRASGFAAPANPFKGEWLVLGVRFDRKDMHRRIEARLDARLAAGMLEEVASLHASGVAWERLERFGLEYRQVALHLQGRMGLLEMRDSLLIKIRQFAKRQDSWFRKMEREGMSIYWHGPDGFDDASALVSAFLRGEPLPEPSFRLKDVDFGS